MLDPNRPIREATELLRCLEMTQWATTGPRRGRRPADLRLRRLSSDALGRGLALFVLVATPDPERLARTGLSGPIGPADIGQCFCSSSFATAWRFLKFLARRLSRCTLAARASDSRNFETLLDIGPDINPRAQILPHSITSSALASRDGGTVRPSALAVFRLMVNSNFVGCTTGSSAGVSPFKIRPT